MQVGAAGQAHLGKLAQQGGDILVHEEEEGDGDLKRERGNAVRGVVINRMGGAVL